MRPYKLLKFPRKSEEFIYLCITNTVNFTVFEANVFDLHPLKGATFSENKLQIVESPLKK